MTTMERKSRDLYKFARHKAYGSEIIPRAPLQILKCLHSFKGVSQGETYLVLRGTSNYDRTWLKNIRGLTQNFSVLEKDLREALELKDIVEVT